MKSEGQPEDRPVERGRCPRCGTPLPGKRGPCPECSGPETADWEPTSSGPARPFLLLNPGASFAGRYRIEEVLGSGGSGIVYRAYDRILDTEVALKLLRSGSSPKDLRRFRREVALAQAVSHPGIVRVHDIGRSSENDYFSMELVAGESLAERLRRRGPLGTHEAWRLLREVAEAVGYLHEAGIVHRDVKPANILLEAGSGRPRLGDFGLARVDDGQSEPTTDVVGTPYYMAPEQILGQAPDVRGDIYSLGVTFYEALSGRKPYEGATGMEIAMGKSLPPVDLRRLRPEVPRTLRLAIERCLAPQPEDRYASATELLDSLGGPPQGGFRRLLRLSSRRLGARAAVLTAVAVLGAVAWSLSFDVRHYAVTARSFGDRVVGRNVWGGTAWEVGSAQRELQVSSWRADYGEKSFFVVREGEERRDRFWVDRLMILEPSGKKVLDTADSETLVPYFHDPLTEFSGQLTPEVMSWSPGFAPPHRSRVFPIRVVNMPWYATLVGFCGPGCRLNWLFSNPGRISSIAASQVPEPRYGLLGGNNELLHLTAFAILPADDPVPAWSPPRMVDRVDFTNRLYSYTLLGRNEALFGTSSVRPRPDGGWDLCPSDGPCLHLDAEGNPPREPGEDENPNRRREARMSFFRRLSQIDAARRSEAFDAAEEQYLALEAEPPAPELLQAVLYWQGARIAAGRGDLAGVVRRTTASEKRWSETADAVLLRATARILAGQHDDALRDLNRAKVLRGSTTDHISILRIASAWLRGDQSLAMRLAESVVYPYRKAEQQGFIRIFEGDPEGALRILDPFKDHYVRDRIQLLRALALVDLGRIDEAREALEAEASRHGWRREECDWVGLAADLAEGREVSPDVALGMLRRAERRGRTDLEVRLLLPRVRLEAARALQRAGEGAKALQLLDAVLADHPSLALAAEAQRLRSTLTP